MENKRAKLKDIAEKLGISITTVSRAINNKSDINPKTKRQILELANKMDYRPNSMARSLRKNQVINVIAVVLPEINHYFFSTVLKGIMSSAHLNNYLVLVGESLHVVEKEKSVLEEFVEYGVTGIIMAPCRESDFNKNVLPLLHKRIPVVIMDRSYDDYKGNFVLTDDFNGAFKAVCHLAEMGYKRIAHLGSTDSESVGFERKKGYLEALSHNNLKIDKEIILLSDNTDAESGIQTGYLLTKKLFNLKNPPDAIFAISDDVAIGAYQFAKENNLNIPFDLGVVGFSNSMISKYVHPKLTTVEQNAIKMGQTAFDYFLNAQKSNGNVFQKVFDLELIIRESSKRNIL